MMTISQLHIENYRSIEDETFDLRPLSILIGKNNVGKSNVVNALAFLLEGTAKTINERNFYDPDTEVCITAKIENVEHFLELSAQKHRDKIAKRIDKSAITVRRTASADGTKPPIGLLDPSSGEFSLPTGIEAGLKQILPEVIMIEAFKDPSPEAIGKSTAVLGKIIKQIVAQVAEKIHAELKSAYDQLNRLLNVVEEEGAGKADGRIPELQEIEQNILRHLASMFEDVDVRIRVDFPGLPDLMTRAQVEIFEGGEWTLPELKGQGMQRVLYVALLQALAEQIRSSTAHEIKRPFILLIEEPEAFLHPSLLGKMRNALESISLSNQVAFATHSPEMVSPHKLSDVILVRKTQNLQGKQHTIRLRAEPQELDHIRDKRRIELMEYQRSSRFLFADLVAVVEGISDVLLLEAMTEALSKHSVDELNIAFIGAGTKYIVAELTRALRSLGLQAIGIVDLDFLWDGAGSIASALPEYSRFMAQFEANYARLKRSDKVGNDSKYNKHEAVDIVFTELSTIYPKVITLIERKCGIYILPSGEIEEYAGISTQAKSQYAEAAIQIRDGKREIKNQGEILHILINGLKIPIAEDTSVR